MFTLLEGGLTTDDYFIRQPESERAKALLVERDFPRAESPTDIVIVRSDSLTVDDAGYRTFVEELFDDLVSLEGPAVVGGRHYYQFPVPSLVSADRHTTVIPFTRVNDADRVDEVLRQADADEHFRVLMTGEAAFNKDFTKISQDDLSVELKVGLPAAVVILVLVFGALVAAAIPLVLALVSIVIALGATALLGLAFEFSFFVTNMIAMMGLAVGVDYSLFVVSRYREERARGLNNVNAIAAAGATASRAVFFSGMTVVLALAGLLVVPYSIFTSLGAGAIIVVVVSVAASLTLLPAVLSLLGDRVGSLRLPLLGKPASANADGQARGFWVMVSRAVMRRPLVSLVVTATLLAVAAIPYFDINLGFPGVSTFPDGFQSKEGFLILEKDFSFGVVYQAQIVIDGDIGSPSVQQEIQRLRARLESDESFGQSQIAINPKGDLAVLSVELVGDPGGAETVGAIRTLRGEFIPEAFTAGDAEVLVTGEEAGDVDFFDLASGYLPIVLAFVLGLSFVLLTIVFRSLVVPIKAIIMNLLSVGAAYGLMVLVFQRGFAVDLLGFQQVDSIAAWIPLFLFTVLFGLSMDYHVFLLSRIRERFVQTEDNSEAVAYGIRSTAGLITGAALIMVAVFAGFAAGKLVMFQQVGFGLAAAILLDATIVRAVLVPAAMKLLGACNWYLPSSLRWLPEVRLDERTTHAEMAGD